MKRYVVFTTQGGDDLGGAIVTHANPWDCGVAKRSASRISSIPLRVKLIVVRVMGMAKSW